MSAETESVIGGEPVVLLETVGAGSTTELGAGAESVRRSVLEEAREGDDRVDEPGPEHGQGIAGQGRSPRSLRFQLLAITNVAFLVGLGVLLMLGYRGELEGRVHDRLEAMGDEATVLLPAVIKLRHHGTEAVQGLVDEACIEMRDSSPGHHIAVMIGDRVLQARTGVLKPNEDLLAIERTARAGGDMVTLGDERIAIGSAASGEVRVYASEDLSDVYSAVHKEMLGRFALIGLFGVTVTVLLDILLLRALVHPVTRLVDTVRAIGSGRLGAHASSHGSSELAMLSNEINGMSDALADAHRETSYQLSRAAEMQKNLLPRPDEFAGASMALVSEPVTEVGGDYVDLRRIDDVRQAVCVADVTGHGVPAAMGASMLKILFDQATSNTGDPGDILRQMNRGFARVTLASDLATAAVAIVERSTRRVQFASAGHEPAILISPGGDVREVPSTGMLLGFMPEANWEVVELVCDRGDRLAIMTDGLMEATDRAGEQFGRERLLDSLRIHRHLAVPDHCRAVISDVSDFIGGARRLDDMTLLILEL